MMMSQSPLQCGVDGNNSRSYSSAADDSTSVGGDGAGEIMLFGVRVKVDPMRKSVSMNNLSQYQQPAPREVNNNQNLDVSAAIAADSGYASADDAVRNQSNGGRERKRGVPWTEDEHKLFLLGLQKVGKGDWRGISKNFVKTRTPTQVASHAQKYFLRRSNLNRRRRRSSLFDITTDSVAATPMEEQQAHEDDNGQSHMLSSQQPSPLAGFPMAAFQVKVGPVLSPVEKNEMETVTFSNGDHQLNTGSSPNPSTRADLNLNQAHETDPLPLSLNLSLSYNPNQSSQTHSSEFQLISCFNNGDGIISVG